MAADLADLYRRDFYAWALNQADELRRLPKAATALDVGNLAEEVEGLAREQRNVVLRQIERLIDRLLQLEHSPSTRQRYRWLIGVDKARFEIGLRLTPSMRPELEASLADCYRHARRSARLRLLDRHERQAADALPPDNPYPLDRLLDEGWYPGNVHGIVVAGEEPPASGRRPRR